MPEAFKIPPTIGKISDVSLILKQNLKLFHILYYDIGLNIANVEIDRTIVRFWDLGKKFYYFLFFSIRILAFLV